MPREVDISRHVVEVSSEEDSPIPRRTHGTSYRKRVVVISDSESDSDLPSPSLLLQDRKVIGLASNFGSVTPTDEIIEISSDSEIEATPTKSRGGKLPSSVHGHQAGNGDSSVSALTSAFHSSLLLSTNDDLSRNSPAATEPTNKTIAFSRPTNSSSTDSEEIDETRLFDQDAHHPGILHFNPGPRKPALLASHSSTSILTSGTSDYSQDLCGKSITQLIIGTGGPSKGYSDDLSDEVGETNNPTGSPRPQSTTGDAKASSSSDSSGYHSRVQADTNGGTALLETPRPRPRPRPKPKPKARSAALTSASVSASLSPKPTPRNQAKALQTAAITLFAELNDSVFGGKLPKDCPIEWSKKLNTTAGRAHWKKIRDANGNVTRHDTRIELSIKVVDCEGFSCAFSALYHKEYLRHDCAVERVRNTLSHEMCHLGAWIFDSEMKPPHGSAFKRWWATKIALSNRIMEARPDITISTCHSYEISYKYEWKCSSGECGRTYGRHSKSIDPEKQVCGACRSKLVPQFETAPKRTAFQGEFYYLKTHMKDFKAANPGIQHGEVMKRLGEMFRAEKEATVDEELDQVMAGMTRLGIDAHAG
ncbi:unnamed protein product [Rhizoctonia solani]|uniref:SprT-like domain-containing protein n=1 Tax=Rhizoctonia solani TaxID=456999 RepID=A0A8H2XZ04_9AGAM|nr:unnamed protein product [Rhizoctonia solani]